MTVAFVLVAFGRALIVFAWADSWTALVVGGFGAETLALTSRFVWVMALAMPASASLVCLSSIEIALDGAGGRLRERCDNTQSLADRRATRPACLYLAPP